MKKNKKLLWAVLVLAIILLGFVVTQNKINGEPALALGSWLKSNPTTTTAIKKITATDICQANITDPQTGGLAVCMNAVVLAADICLPGSGTIASGCVEAVSHLEGKTACANATSLPAQCPSSCMAYMVSPSCWGASMAWCRGCADSVADNLRKGKGTFTN